MIRGAIDYITDDRVGGWLFSSEGATRDHVVLAFLDGTCIGAGRIDQYRDDLAQAGIGDGHVGFNFGIDPIAYDDLPRVTVRLEGSDLSLIQPSARIAGKHGVGPRASSARSPSEIEWMLDQGWLTHDEYDYLKLLGATGGYARSLRQQKADGAGIDAPQPVAEAYLALIAQDAVTLVEMALADVAELVARRAELLGTLAQTIVALSAEDRTEIVATKAMIDEDDAPRETSLTIGPDRLLLLDLACSLAAGGDGGAGLKLWGVKPSGT